MFGAYPVWVGFIQALGIKVTDLRNPCAICGARESTTRDHVPPKAIFTKPFPLALITVPACQACNNGSSQYDERFRVFLGMVVGDRNEKAKKLWKERSLATLRKNRKLVTSISEGMHEVDLYAQDRTLVGKRTAFLWPVKDFESVVERIARGLYYYHFNEILGPRVTCEAGLLYSLSKEFIDLSEDWAENHIGDGAFSYRYAHVGGVRAHSLWVMEFYQGLWAFVEMSPLDA